MEIKVIMGKLKALLQKYKYAVVVLLIGLVLLMIPETKVTQTQQIVKTETKANTLDSKDLSEILQAIDGAGQVKVLLSLKEGEETLYQSDQELSSSGESSITKTETVLITDDRTESGLIKQINPPQYLGAIVVCQGADSPAVRLAITQAVSRITGLGADNICVLKMK